MNETKIWPIPSRDPQKIGVCTLAAAALLAGAGVANAQQPTRECGPKTRPGTTCVWPASAQRVELVGRAGARSVAAVIWPRRSDAGDFVLSSSVNLSVTLALYGSSGNACPPPIFTFRGASSESVDWVCAPPPEPALPAWVEADED